MRRRLRAVRDELGDRPDLPGRRRIGRALGALVLVAAVAPFVVHAVPALVGADESYVVLSGSMEPAIGTGDSVLVRRVDPGAIEEGDVVTFGEPPGEPTTHRVIEVVETDGGPAFRTQGDANAAPDGELVTPSEIRGKVVHVLPLIGYVLWYGGTPLGLALLVGAPVALLVGGEVRSVLRSGRANRAGRTDGSATPDAGDEPDAGPSNADGAAVESGDDAIAVTRFDLRATLVVLVALAAYSAAVAVLHRSFWSVGVAVAAGGTALFLGAVWYAAPSAEPDATTDDGPSDPAAIPDGGEPE
ncbi:signal peptidase I [Halomarina pelagica]|uniref:signal peptidase I n=1 Tax=Halomarina pelagica TaxID=2961599 RepID=UPI0020C42E88|nr:signal peptidase I [Halomarina sp. BND7]